MRELKKFENSQKVQNLQRSLVEQPSIDFKNMDKVQKQKLAKRDYDGYYFEQLKLDGNDKVFQKEQALLGSRTEVKDTKEIVRLEEKKKKLRFKKEMLLPSKEPSPIGSPSNRSLEE